MLSPKKLETKKKNVCNACCYLWYNRERDWNSSSNASQIICVRTEFAIASAQITSFCLSDVAPLQLLSSRWFCVCVRGALFKYSALVITLFFFFIIIFSSYFFYIISSRSISLLLAASGLSLWYILVVMAGRCCCRCCTSMAHTLRFILISQFFLFFTKSNLDFEIYSVIIFISVSLVALLFVKIKMHNKMLGFFSSLSAQRANFFRRLA